MSRGFFCIHCGQPINVADDFPNLTMPCPHCGQPVQQLPQQLLMRRVEPSGPEPTPFTVSELFQDAWNIGLKCWQPFLMMGAILGGLNLFIFLGSYIGSFASVFVIGALIEQTPDIGIGPIIAIVGILLTIALVVSLVMVWLYSGAVMYSLAIVRGEQPPVSMLFCGMKHFWGILITGANITVLVLCAMFVIIVVTGVPPVLYLAFNPEPNPALLFGVLVILMFVGFGATMISSLWVGVMFCLSYFFVVDRQQKPVEAMKSSYRYVRAHFWTVLGSILLLLVCTMAVGWIPLVGILLTVPVSHCLYAVLYLKITGQKHCLSP